MSSLDSEILLKYSTGRRPPGQLSTIMEVGTPVGTDQGPCVGSPEGYQPLYVPTAREEYEMQQEEQMRQAMQGAIDMLIYQGEPPCPPPPTSPKARPAPICVPELSPSQLGFKWLENFIPMEHNFPKPPTPPAPPKSQAVRRPGAPGQRPCPPGRQAGARPGARPGAPGARPGAPCARPGAPGARPGAPGARPGAPCARPGAPGARPGAPGARPGARPGAPGARPGARPCPPGRQAGPAAQRPGPPGRQAGPAAPKPCPPSSRVSKRLAESAARLSQMKKPPQKETTRPPPSPPKKISQAKLRESLARLTKRPASKGAPPKVAVRPSRPPPGRAPPGRQAGPAARRPGAPGAPGQRPCPPGRQAGPAAQRPGPPGRQAGPAARRPGPPGAPGQRPCPPGRQAGPAAQRPGPPGQRPCPPGRQAGPAARQAGPAARRPGPPGAPGQRPCPPGRQAGPPARQAGPPGQRPCPPSRRAPPAAAGSPDSPYEVRRLPGVQDIMEGGPVPIVTVRKTTEVQGPRIYMPPEAILERDKRMAAMRAAGRKYHRPAPQAVCPPPSSRQTMGPPRELPPRKPAKRSVCPPKGPPPRATPDRLPPTVAPVAPSKGPCPGRREIAPPARPPAPRQAPRPPPPTMPQTPLRPLPPSVPLPLTGEICDVLEGGPVPIVTTRNANQMQSGPRIYMPAEAILERQQRFAQREANARAAQEAAAMMAQRTSRDLQARAGIKVPTVKKSVSVTTLTGGRTAVVKKTSLELVGGPKSGSSRPTRQDRGRRR